MGDTKIIDTGLLFIALVILAILLGEMATYFLNINELLYKDLSEQLTLQQIEELFKSKTKWAWAGYVLLPVLLFLKITVIAWVLAIGGFFSELELRHKHYFRIVLLAEFILLLPGLLKILWFYFYEPDFTLERVQQFVPFSLQSIMDVSGIPDWAIYPLQLINLFEFLYWILLAYLIDRYAKTNQGIKVVLMSYAPALLVWVVFIMFLTLNYSI